MSAANPTDAQDGSGPIGSGPARRSPVQDRGRRRVEQILDAAAEVIGEVGVDYATTNMIALRARTSVGVLDRFFPHTRAIIEMLAVRYVHETERILSRQEQAGIAVWPLPQAVEWVLHALTDFHQAHPAYQHVYRSVRGSSSPEGIALLDHTRVVVDRLLALRADHVPPQDREWHAATVVEAAHALVVQACALAPDRRARLIHETALMLTRYLTPDYAPLERD